MTISPLRSRVIVASVGLAVFLSAVVITALVLHHPRGPFALSDAAERPDSLVVSIESRFAIGPLVVGPRTPRTDLSGLVVPLGPACGDSTPRRPSEFWMVNDKADRLESMIVRARPDPDGGDTLVIAPMEVLNPDRFTLGEDIEDLARLAGTCGQPVYVAACGETGPGGAGVSWLYLFEERDDRLTLRWTGVGSPPGESVGNNGFEGVALVRLGADTLVLLGFKERPGPTYVRSFLFREVPGRTGSPAFAAAAGADTTTLVPIEPVGMDRIDGMSTQAGASVSPAGDLYVLDRLDRRIAVIDRSVLESALRDTAQNLVRVREWLDFTDLEPRLENKEGSDAPLSPFGTAEGITFGPDGRLYLLADNNEAGPSTIMTLVPIVEAPPPR